MRNYRQSQGSAEPCMLSPSYDDYAASTVLMKDPYKLSSLVPLASALSKLALTTILPICLSLHNWGVTFALLPQYSYGSMDRYQKYGSNNFQEFYMSEEK